MRLLITLSFFLCMLPVRGQAVITYDENSGLSHWKISSIVQDQHGFIWLSTWNGLNRYDGYEFRQVKTSPGDGSNIQSEVIRGMMLDDAGNIICKTDQDLFMLDTKDYKYYNIDSEVEIPKCTTLKDHQGNLWEIQRYGCTKTPNVHHPAQLIAGTENVQARAFLRDQRNRWWLATKEDECLRIYDHHNKFIGFLGKDGVISKQPTRFGYRVYCMLQTQMGDVWIGCKPGKLLRLRERIDGSFEILYIPCDGLAGKGIYHIVEDFAGRLWVATFGSGIFFVEHPGDTSPSCFGMGGNDKVRRLLVTKSSNLIAATTNGLLVGHLNSHDAQHTTFRRITRDGKRAASLAGNATMDVVNYGEGEILVAMENNGIDIISEDSLLADIPSFRHYSTANSSLTSDACLAIVSKSDGKIFIVCSDGLMEWNPSSDQTTTYASNFWNMRCRFSEERPTLLPDSSWIFGQEQGAYRATRHHLETRGHKPPLVFTELHISGKPADLGVVNYDTLIIHTDERNFSIGYAALDYTDNSSICYRVRLNGGQWSHSSNSRSLSFYDMLPGEYTLDVQSTDHYGRWVNNQKSLHIVVLPFWYETWWAKALAWMAILIIITVIVFITFYIRQLHRQRKELLTKYLSLLNSGDDNSENTASVLPLSVSTSDRRFLERVKQYISENIGNSSANIDEMASMAAVSRSTLNRKLRSLMGVTATQLLIDARLEKARQMLSANVGQSQAISVTEVSYKCGYTDPRYFSRCFKQKYGKSPSEYNGVDR